MSLDKNVIEEFIEVYNVARLQLLAIQNVCNEQTFPEITE